MLGVDKGEFYNRLRLGTKNRVEEVIQNKYGKRYTVEFFGSIRYVDWILIKMTLLTFRCFLVTVYLSLKATLTWWSSLVLIRYLNWWYFVFFTSSELGFPAIERLYKTEWTRRSDLCLFPWPEVDVWDCPSLAPYNVKYVFSPGGIARRKNKWNHCRVIGKVLSRAGFTHVDVRAAAAVPIGSSFFLLINMIVFSHICHKSNFAIQYLVWIVI